MKWSLKLAFGHHWKWTWEIKNQLSRRKSSQTSHQGTCTNLRQTTIHISFQKVAPSGQEYNGFKKRTCERRLLHHTPITVNTWQINLLCKCIFTQHEFNFLTMHATSGYCLTTRNCTWAEPCLVWILQICHQVYVTTRMCHQHSTADERYFP